MKLCFSTLACPEWTWDKILTFAKECGYSGIEVRGVLSELHASNMPQFQPGAIKATKARLSELGLQIACLSSACEIQRPVVWEQTRDMAMKYIDIAKALGVPYVRVLADVAPSPMGKVDDLTVRFAAKELGDYAGKNGVTILIESNGAYADSRRLRALLDEIAMPSVAALWDINHPIRFFGEAPETTYDHLAPYIRHVHVKDSYMIGSRVLYCAFGDGDLPVQPFFRVLLRKGYDGYFSLEWLKRWEDYLDDPEYALRAFMRYVEFV